MISSTRDDIWAEVNKRVAEQLPAALLDAGVVRHKNISIHEDCTCEYCKTRRRMTTYVANAGRAVVAGLGQAPPGITRNMETVVHMERVFRKLVARETLKRLLP
ncbi:MAG: hypothetical protein AB7U75_14590 [Hyphomicrobiaceae bacterium]